MGVLVGVREGDRLAPFDSVCDVLCVRDAELDCVDVPDEVLEGEVV